jgi:cardiolipin synthase A/B
VTQASQREGFGEVLDGGIQLHEYAPALLHTKVMIIDSIWATVGSTNFDNRSMAMNDELNVIFYDEPIAKRLAGNFLKRSLTLKEGFARACGEPRMVCSIPRDPDRPRP